MLSPVPGRAGLVFPGMRSPILVGSVGVKAGWLSHAATQICHRRECSERSSAGSFPTSLHKIRASLQILLHCHY